MPAVVLLLAALALALSACGGSSSPSASVAANGSTGTTAATGPATKAGAPSKSGTTPATKQDAGASKARAKALRGRRGTMARAFLRRLKARAGALRACLSKYGLKTLQPPNTASDLSHWRAALAQCGLGGIGRARARARRQLLASPFYRQKLRSFASCMRTHGVPGFPEPNTSGSGPVFNRTRLPRGPQVVAARKACTLIVGSARR